MDQQFEGTVIHSKGRVSSVVVMLISELSLPIKVDVLEEIEMSRGPEHLKLNLNGRVCIVTCFHLLNISLELQRHSRQK
jgi:hypothetical protein